MTEARMDGADAAEAACARLDELLAGCPDALGAGIRGDQRDEAALGAVREHVAACASCRAGLHELRTVDRLLVGAFRWLASDLRPQRTAILARLGEAKAVSASAEGGLSSGRHPVLRTTSGRLISGRARPAASPRRVGWFFALHAVAALALLTGYLGYVSLLRLERSDMARLTRMDVRNVALAMQQRALEQGRELPPASRSALLLALGVEHPDRPAPAEAGLPRGRVAGGQLMDAFGRALVYARNAPREARIYSLGPNGRDEGGSGDDIVALVTLPPR